MNVEKIPPTYFWIGIGVVVLLLLGGAGVFEETPLGPYFEQFNQWIIIAIARVRIGVSTYNILSGGAIDPTFYVWRERATEPTEVSIISGAGSVSVAPNESIQWAAGGWDVIHADSEETGVEHLYYWEKENLTAGVADMPLEVKLYAVAECGDLDLRVFDMSYRDLTDGNFNMSVMPGEDLNLQVQFTVMGEYFAVRRPHICVDYNPADVNRVKISKLKEVDPPRRIISGLDQCFDTGLGYYNYTEPLERHGVWVDAVSGQKVSSIKWYVVDQDLWWKDGKLYFYNPITHDNMGAGAPAWGDEPQKTCSWNITTWFE